MTSPQSTSRGFPVDEPGLPETARLLKLGLTEAYRPIDGVLDRLRRRDGAEWLTRGLSEGVLHTAGTPEALLLQGQASIEQLQRLKDETKLQLHKAEDSEARLRAIVAYFFIVAAALVHHRRRICSRTREELDPILLDLAEVASDPWSEWLGRASLAVEAP